MTLPERERNDLLRRVDWRFLVPQEETPVVAAPHGGLALVARDAAGGEPVDVAVLVNPRRHELATAAAALRPGGTLYVEWYRPQLGGRERLARVLETAGLERVRWYWPWPRPSRRPAFWLPIDAPGALAYFLGLRRTVSARRRRALAAIWPWALRLRLLAPLCAVAQRPGGAPDAVEAAVAADSSWILLTGGRRSVNKVVGVPVPPGADRPELIVKFARSADEEESLRNEAVVLRLLEQQRPDLRGVPHTRFLERRCGRLALGETALDGQPLVWNLDRDNVERLSTTVTDWLVALAGTGPRLPRSDWGQRLVDEPLARFAREFEDVLTAEEIARARAALAALDDLPLVCEQRDLAPWNVLLADGGVSVVDWESAEPYGLPVLDLVYFLTNAALLVAGVLDTGPVAPAVAAAERLNARLEASYCERVGVAPELVPPLRLLCWTIHAGSEHRRFELDAAGPPTRATLESSLFLELWRLELASLELS